MSPYLRLVNPLREMRGRISDYSLVSHSYVVSCVHKFPLKILYEKLYDCYYSLRIDSSFKNNFLNKYAI